MKIISKARQSALSLAIIISGLTWDFATEVAQGANVKDSVDVESKTIKNAQDSQKTIDTLSEQTQKMLDEYKLVLRQSESLKAYNDQMERLVVSQENEKASLEKQIGEIELTSREVVPMMSEMLTTLSTFVSLDVPFLPQERQDRIANLQREMDRADISTSEKFRRIMEAYQIESEYGRTIEAYRADISDESQKKLTVDFLKIGRIALLYQTLDGKISRAWDVKTKTWLTLDDKYRKTIQEGLKIARKQSAPDLLTLPIPTAEAI